MSGPLKAPGFSGGTGAVASEAHVESRRPKAADAFSGSGGNLEPQFSCARAGGVEANKRAATLVSLGREKKPARRDEIKRLFRGRDGAQNKSAWQRQRLLGRPQCVDLRARCGDDERVKVQPELRKPFRIRNAVFGEASLRRRPKKQAVALNAARPRQGESKRRRFLAGRGRRHLDEAAVHPYTERI